MNMYMIMCNMCVCVYVCVHKGRHYWCDLCKWVVIDYSVVFYLLYWWQLIGRTLLIMRQMYEVYIYSNIINIAQSKYNILTVCL